MTSTVLDVVVCLLLVSGAVVVLAGTAPGSPSPSAAAKAPAVAETLATSTATVEYDLVPTDGDPPTPEHGRVAHGTLAELLAAATVAGVEVDGTRATTTADGFRAAVRSVVAASTGRRMQVIARWEPYPGAHLAGELTVGPSPPRTATVHAVTLSVPARFHSPSEEARAGAGRDGYAGVARVVARTLVAGLFPPAATRLALADDDPLPTLVRKRYRRVGAAYGVRLGTVRPPSVTATNSRLADAVATRVEADLRRGMQSPREAADALALGKVRIVVRTWSA